MPCSTALQQLIPFSITKWSFYRNDTCAMISSVNLKIDEIMKKMTTTIRNNFKRTFLLAALFSLLLEPVSATTFTAVASGNFSSSATWGGAAPPNLLVNDNVVIPLGIKVTLDDDYMINGATAGLTVFGSLSSSTSNYIMFKSGTMNGNGSIDIDSFAIDASTGFNFSGNLTVDAFTSMGAKLSSSANTMINNKLYLMAGTLNITGGTLKVDDNATIIVDGGTMTMNGGTVDLTSKYHVMFAGSTTASGIEVTGAGLTDVTIDLANSGSSVALSSNMMVNGMLMLKSGSLNLNGNELAIGAMGDFSAMTGNNIMGSATSDVTIMSSLTNGLVFSATANTVNDLTIEAGKNAQVKIASDVKVHGMLDLKSGMVMLNDNMLKLEAGASVSGGSDSAFVVTGTNGRLMMNVMAGSSGMFHVGTMNNGYSPIMLTAASGSATSDLSVGVDADVKAWGTAGASMSNTQPLVDATWYVESSASANIDLDMDVWWSAAMELNSFNRSKAYISHYTSGSWDMTATAAATMSSSGMYKMSRTGITSLSPFAVFDENTAAAVNDVNANDIVSIYPNPVTSKINIDLEGNATQTLRADIYNMNGQVVKSNLLKQAKSTIQVNDLPAGMYFIRINGDEVNASARFVKE